LALLSVSDDAWAMMQKRDPRRNTYLSILDWKEKWIEGGAFPYTPSVSLVYGLHEALTMVLEEGLEAAWARHETCARACRAGILGMGLELWPESESIAASSCTAFRTPAGVDSTLFRHHLRETYGVMIAPGYGEIKEHVLRIGHMGHVAKPVHVLAALGALGKALHDVGVPVSPGRGADAALAAL
jgi:pyridoxamine--pyruvate transaminase